MSYLEKNLTYKNKKINVGARVPEVVIDALHKAEEDSKDLGYTFSLTSIIEKALKDTLDELVEKTGMDYLALEQFKYQMETRQEKRKITPKDSSWIDFEKKTEEIKYKALNNSSIDLNLLIQDEEKKTTEHWDDYVLNRKEKEVETELRKLEIENINLNTQIYDVYRDSESYLRDEAIGQGWGDKYDEAIKASKEAFDKYLELHEDQIQKQKEAKGKGLIFLSHTLFEKNMREMYPKKTEDEIKKIMKGWQIYESIVNEKLKKIRDLKKKFPKKTDEEIQKIQDEIEKDIRERAIKDENYQYLMDCFDEGELKIESQNIMHKDKKE